MPSGTDLALFREIIAAHFADPSDTLRLDVTFPDEHFSEREVDRADGFVLNMDLNTDGNPRTTRFTNQFHSLLTMSATWGRSEASYLARVVPAQHQFILDNASGVYDPGKLLPRSRVDFDWLYRGELLPVARGFLKSVRPSIDHSTGLKTVVVIVEGALALLNNADHRLSLFVTEAVNTGEVVEAALDQVDFPVASRAIDRGQVRIHPAFYADILSSRQIGFAGPVLRATEEAELGLVHEGRGAEMHFEDRFHRELDGGLTGDPEFVLGSTPYPGSTRTLRVLGTTDPEDSWEHIRTVVQIGADKEVVQSEGRVFDLQATIDIAGATSLVVPTVPVTFSLLREEDNRTNRAVKSVISWSPILPSHYEFRRGGSVDNSGLAITVTSEDRFARTVIISNTGTAATLTKLEMYGRGVALYGEFSQYHKDDEAIKIYGRRLLDIPNSFIGNGLNYGGDAVEEGRANAELLLAKYAKPQIHGRLLIDPLENELHREAMVSLTVSDRVTVQEDTGLPLGLYHVEGGSFRYEGATGLAEMGINVSRRGRARNETNRPLSYTPSTAWANVTTPSIALTDGLLYIVAARVAFPEGSAPSDSDNAVLRLRHGTGNSALVAKTWVEQAIPIGDSSWLAALVKGDGSSTVVFQARQRTTGAPRLTVSWFRIIQVED